MRPDRDPNWKLENDMVGRGGIYGNMHGDGQPVGGDRDPATEPRLVFWYRNYKGEEGYRCVKPVSMRFGASEYHKEPQWLLLADDTVNHKRREFAMKDMSGIVGTPTIWISGVVN